MKIISGKYKGRKLDGFDIDGTRPTMDRVKESLFAIIQNYISESIVLDLFAGSGNLGIEALSEGAKYAYLVDKNIKCIKTIKKNVNNIGIENVKIIHNDYRKVLKDINKKFDLIFLDPPYKTNCIEESIKLIDEYNLLNDNGISPEGEEIIKDSVNEIPITVPMRHAKYMMIDERMRGIK